mmetsp:Transcript_17088/g.19191  ORF Transcript_17088/g.19191 Transcript_17088/m.19191 type:complete len:281 (+) Transcript_17088:95-937(+)
MFGFVKNIKDSINSGVEQIKSRIEQEKKILQEEQAKIEQKEHDYDDENIGELPWDSEGVKKLGEQVQSDFKKDILNLSQSRDIFFINAKYFNFEYEFDYDGSIPIARAILAMDPQLGDIRFTLVPKKLREETFWRNYFYQIEVLKLKYGLETDLREKLFKEKPDEDEETKEDEEDEHRGEEERGEESGNPTEEKSTDEKKEEGADEDAKAVEVEDGKETTEITSTQEKVEEGKTDNTEVETEKEKDDQTKPAKKTSTGDDDVFGDLMDDIHKDLDGKLKE